MLPILFLQLIAWTLYYYDLELRGVPAFSPRKSFSDFNEIQYVDTGRWLTHDGMPCDPIQGQGQGQSHEWLKAIQE